MHQPESSRSRLTIFVRNVSNACILDLIGPLGTGEPLQIFRAQINELLDGAARNFAINITKVPYMDSSGIGALVGAHTSIETIGGKCKLFGVMPRVRRLLELVHLDTVLELFDDEASALASF